MNIRCRSVALVLLTSTTTWAADVKVTSTTIFSGRPDVVDGQVRTVIPMVEMVGLRVRRIDTPVFDDVGVTVDAWGALTVPGAPPAGLSGDVNLVFVEGLTFKKHLFVRLGRQFVSGGVARNQYFDGLAAEFRGPAGFGLSAFVGQPVAARFANFLKGEVASGARLFWAPSINAAVGTSFIHTADRSAVLRQDIGADARWSPVRSVTLNGAITWSIADKRLAELDVGARWAPLEDLDFGLQFRRSAPDLFLARNSIFTVFADSSRDDLGASATYQMTRSLSFYGDGRALWINGELGYELGLRAAAKSYTHPKTVAHVQLRRLSVPSSGLTHGRIGGRHVLPVGVGLSLDFETYLLDKAVRGKAHSFSVSTTASWELDRLWLVGVTAFAGSTPFYDSRLELMAKLTYTFDHAGGAP